MSRSGYSDDYDNPGLWNGTVNSAIRGKRGQKFMQELREALDAMPEKALISGELEENGQYCALGVVGAKRGINMMKISPDEPEQVADAFGIACALAQEIAYINDECGDRWEMDGDKRIRHVETPETPEERWIRVRKWVDDPFR